ncbi:MAG: heavy metal translocating P-type ATPase [Desulfococcaceae bacterium]
MQDIRTEKYRVRNVDCANCAAKIEEKLQKIPGVREAVFDFANLTLHVRAADIQAVVDEVHRVEPDIELVSAKAPAAGQADATFSPYRSLRLLGAAVVLFGILLASEFEMMRPLLPEAEIGIAVIAYLLAGWNVLAGAFRTIRRGDLFDENVLMVIATAGAFGIQAYGEAVGVMIFYKIGELLQDLAVNRSRRSIHSLLAARPDTAYRQTAEGFEAVSPESVEVGELILVKPGDKVPLDGEVVSGRSQLDSSALTGEFVPLSADPGDPVLAGQINQTGALTVRVTRPFTESSIAKVLDLVENASARKAPTEKFITVFARYYTPAVVAAAAGVAFIPPLVFADAGFQEWIYRALVLLVISCPCALVVSIPLGYFGGIGRASREGILIKGSNYIDALVKVKTVIFDKTGTLTRGVFKVKDVVSQNGYSPDQLLEFAAAAESYSNHPIAASIRKAYEETGRTLDTALISDHTETGGKGVRVQYKSHTILVGSDSMMHFERISHRRCEFDTTVAHVAVDGKYAGYLLIGDELRSDAAAAVKGLREEGVDHIAMLTGDNTCAAESVAHRLGLDSFHANLLPEEKVARFEAIQEEMRNGGKIAFVGDGINDAPVIARADIGVAMGALGSDAAIETADVVLMTDAPSKMTDAVRIAGHTRTIVWQNIFLALSIKGLFVVLGIMGLASMWEAVFADMGTALLAVVNSTRTLGRRRKKKARPAQSEEAPA